MSRTVSDASITTKAARERLEPRDAPYWRAIEGGLALGYRRGVGRGSWKVRLLGQNGHYAKATLGRADDLVAANGSTVLDYAQAASAARKWADKCHRVAAGLEAEPSKVKAKPYTVAEACRDYLTDYTERGGKASKGTANTIKTHILPDLGDIALPRLTRDKLKAWHRGVAASDPRRAGAEISSAQARQATANRVMTVLKAALNLARREGRVVCTADAWDQVKAFKGVDVARVRYLSIEEITRLLNASSGDFRELVTAALLTGCRYGELCAARMQDFDASAGALFIAVSKSGKPRHVALNEQGIEFFKTLSVGKERDGHLFMREGLVQQATRKTGAIYKRVAWSKSDQHRYMQAACKAANITPTVGFHVLRHSYASGLAMAEVGMEVIAAQLGHSDSKITAKHYAHLGPSYISSVIKKSLPKIGVIEAGNVVGLCLSRKTA